MKRKINSWSDYEKFKISQDIEKFFGDFVVDIKFKEYQKKFLNSFY